jgi:hypothetical protein
MCPYLPEINNWAAEFFFTSGFLPLHMLGILSIQLIGLFYIKNPYSEGQINGELPEMSLLTLWQCRLWHILRYFPRINATLERMTNRRGDTSQNCRYTSQESNWLQPAYASSVFSFYQHVRFLYRSAVDHTS